MKKMFLVTTLIALSLGLTYGLLQAQQNYGGSGMGKGMHGGWMCPWMSGRAPSAGGWYCPWMSGQGQQYGTSKQSRPGLGMQPGQTITESQAKTLLENYALRGNPDLSVGQIEDKGSYYEAEILNRSGAVVQKIQVNKETGWFRPAR